jgi:hypothetical protein
MERDICVEYLMMRSARKGSHGPYDLAAYSSLLMSFEANHGRTDPQMKFLAHAQGYPIFLTDTKALFGPAPSGQATPICGG